MNEELFDYEYDLSNVLTPCIYFLYDKDEIVYIGKTEYGLKRILTHTTDKQFDSFKIKVFDKNILSEKETYYIAKYNPKYNKLIPNSYCAKNIKHILSIKYGLKIKKRDIVEWILNNVCDYYYFKGERYISEINLKKCLTYFTNKKL